MKKFLLVLLFVFVFSVLANAEFRFVTNSGTVVWGISSGGGGSFLLGTSNTRVTLVYRLEESDKIWAEQNVLLELKKQLYEQLSLYNSIKKINGSNQFQVVVDIMETSYCIPQYPRTTYTLSNVQKYGLEVFKDFDYESRKVREILYYIIDRTKDIIKSFNDYLCTYGASMKMIGAYDAFFKRTFNYVREAQIPKPTDKPIDRNSQAYSLDKEFIGGAYIKLDLTFDVFYNQNGNLYSKESDYILW